MRSSSDNARWIIGVLVLLAGVFALIATVAYPFCYGHDYIALHPTETDNPRFDDSVSNPCGPLGARLAEYYPGLQAFALPTNQDKQLSQPAPGYYTITTCQTSEAVDTPNVRQTVSVHTPTSVA